MDCDCRAIIEREGKRGCEILIQVRNKPYEWGTSLELSGGRVEEFEALVNTLRREVREETGLDFWYIGGEQARVETNGVDTNVECILPFTACQTLRGPVDSMGVYFLCRTKGQLLERGMKRSSHAGCLSLSSPGSSIRIPNSSHL